MPCLAVAAWLGGLGAHLAHSWDAWLPGGLVAVALLAGLAGRGRPRSATRWLVVSGLVLAAAVATSTLLRHEAVSASPLHELADRRATADLVATVVSDPRRVEGQWGDSVVVRLRVAEVTARGRTVALGGTVVVLGEPSWSQVTLGERVLAEGRLAPSDDPGEGALLTGARAPVRIRGPDPWWRAAAAVRASVRDAVAHRRPEEAGLVPALVTGDDATLPARVESDFRTTGLTHLTAVSGMNLTIVAGALLLLARAVGVRGRWLTVVGLVGIVGFVLVARTEPSVLRAAAMGTVALFAFGPDGRRRGLRALGVAVVALLLVAPALAVTAGFALSVLATAGIVLLGPPLARALGGWLPRGLPEALAVPTAAQLACTPVVAALSGEVSLVAVLANLLAGPAVAPATVLGLLGGLLGLVWPGGGRQIGTGAGWCVGWVVQVAAWGAGLPGASVAWGGGPAAVGALVVVCGVVAVLLPTLLRRPRTAALLAVLGLVVVLGVPDRLWPPGGPGWPPQRWLLVACDVGQGDALVVATGPRSAVVVDAGPDPAAVDGCLDRLGVEHVPLVVLSHFHADHVAGLEGVLRGRRVAAVESSPVLDPPGGVAEVRRVARRAGVPVAAATFGTTRRYGAATLQVVHPDLPTPVDGAGDGSSANDASVVLLVEVGGLRVLLTGDLEPPGQARLAGLLGDLDVDVLKVPHHGSAHQDAGWLVSLRPEVAVVSVGADNGYGHPAPDLLGDLEGGGAEVVRTDEGGDAAVTVDDAGTAVVVTRD